MRCEYMEERRTKMEIILKNEYKKLDSELDGKVLFGRSNARKLYDQLIKKMLDNCNENPRKVIINCNGISAASSSFIDELFFICIFFANCQHGNSILVLNNLSDELYFNIQFAVQGKKGLIEQAKKRNAYSSFSVLMTEKGESPYYEEVCFQMGSPYLICEKDGKTIPLGFSAGEKQQELIERLITTGEKITASQLAEEEAISITAANNRLSRLFEKNLLFRESDKENSKLETYVYWYK